MSTIYVCTRMTKEAVEDDFEHGEEPNTEVFCCEERSTSGAPTLRDLMKALSEEWALDIEFAILDDDEGNGTVDSFRWNRMETDEGQEEATPEQVEKWKKGELKLYLATFTFYIQKRTAVQPVLIKQFEDEGIKME